MFIFFMISCNQPETKVSVDYTLRGPYQVGHRPLSVDNLTAEIWYPTKDISQETTIQSAFIDTEEDINSQFYFVRAKNSEFNYTNNPSFTSGSSKGTILFSSMRMNPKVLITTVGLYNDENDLLATAKLSQPIAKDFTKEALIRVKLDF